MTVRLYNTAERRLVDFKPIEEGKAGLYCCGPTVYNFAHIGNLRTYVFEDLLRRVLTYAGYRVRHIMNVTDVGHLTDDADEGEDKMEKSAREKGQSVQEIADFYTRAFFTDTEKLNILEPTVACAATKHIGEMIGLVRRLEEKGYTYEAGGNIYFDTRRFPGYGKMALLDQQELISGARVAVDQNKKNPEDFVLWFTNSKFENHIMSWNSPWGEGYPGWHLECSAMSMKYLGDHFDIHCGGVDHIPVHHTNEIAQSEAATGSRWVNYWVHGEFLLMEKKKMAKSAGNFVTLQSLIDQGFDPLDYRYFCLGGHYRSQLIFSDASLEAARNARTGIVERIRRLKAEADPAAPEKWGESARAYRDEFREHLSNDLNAPRGLATLWGCLKDSGLPADEKLAVVLDMDRVLGLRLDEVEAPSAELSPEEQEWIRQREEARKSRNFALSDELRDKLAARGVEVKDTPQGTRWTKRV